MDSQRHRRGSIVDEPRDEITYCAKHKKTPTNVRCGRCDTPVCPQCLVFAPVGVRCSDCGKPPKLPQHQIPLPILLRALAASLAAGAAGGVLLSFVLAYLGDLFYLIAAAGVGYLVSEATSFAAQRKRGPILGSAAAFGAVAGHATIIVPIIFLVGGIPFIILLGTAIAAFVAFLRLRYP